MILLIIVLLLLLGGGGAFTAGVQGGAGRTTAADCSGLSCSFAEASGDNS